MSDFEQTFSCPQCGQQFPWKPHYAGRKLACACGTMIEIAAPVERDTYDLADETPKTSKTPAKVESLDDPPPGQLTLNLEGEEVTPPPVAKPAKVLNYRRLGKPDLIAASDEPALRRTNVLIPLAMIGVSVLLLALLAFMMKDSHSRGAIAWNLSARIIWDLAMTLIAGMVIYWSIDAGLGEFHTGILKLIAIGLLRFSISAVIQPDGNLLFAMGGFLLTFPMLVFCFNYLFEFDFTESMFCSVILSFMRLISYFGLWKIL